jgi:NAD(P)H-dependent flavin oxidoreductase YrpB (nitropropane dioxygenase family)
LGDLVEGELEIGQVSARINQIENAADVVKNIMEGFVEVTRKGS